ncbi:MAG: LacI family DNA-binding transcriptional regulator, partial [bacterium]
MKRSIEQIAEIAGVSKTTVSLIVNAKARQNRINPKTEERVLRIIRDNGYLTNQYARGLRLKKTRTIGLVTADITNRFFSQLAKSIENIAREKGYHLIVGNSDDNLSREREVVDNLLSKSIDGLIISSVQKKDELSKKLRENNVCGVYIDRKITHSAIPCVITDNSKGTYQIISHFIARGLSRIAFIGGMRHLSTNKERFSGYKKALLKNRIACDPGLVVHGGFAVDAGYKSAKHLLASCAERPQAIFTASFTLFEGLLNFLKEKYNGIPSGMGLATFDHHPLLEHLP